MRRFEFTEGSSSKFWEVEVAGSSLTVRFGKLGTNGQTKVKELATAQEAASEADSLIREKTGKGYVEVGAAAASVVAPVSKPAAPAASSAAPARAVASAPASARSSDLEGEVVIPEEAKKRVLTWRGGPPPAEVIEAGIPEKLFAQIRTALPNGVELLRRGQTAAESPAAKKRFDDLLAWTTLEDLDVERAANSHVVLRWMNVGRKTLIRFWGGVRGPAFALEALGATMERDVLEESGYHKFGDGIVPFAERSGSADSARDKAFMESFESAVALRTLVAAATDADYQKVVKAAPAVAKVGPLAAALVAFVLSEERALVESIAAEIAAKPRRKVYGWPEAELALASVRDAALGSRLAVHVSDLSPDSACLWTCIARLGPAASAVFAQIEAVDPDRCLLPYLQALHTPLAFRAMLPLLSIKKVAKPLQKFLLDHPSVTHAAVLPAAADAKHPANAAAKLLLGALESAHPELRSASPAAASSSSAPSMKEASSAALPKILVDPPWLARKAQPKAAAAVVELHGVREARRRVLPAG
ncbi:MAG: WGR domain-containing protein [Myxococcales bacterium]